MQLARQAHSCRPDALQHCAPTPLGSCRVRQLNSQATQGRRKSFTKGLGKDAAEGWLDLAKLVSSSGGPKSAFEDLAYELGRDVYMDMNGWHLYLRDITAGKGLKLHQALAQQLGMEAKTLQRQSQLEELLKKVPVSLGGGKMQKGHRTGVYVHLESRGFNVKFVCGSLLRQRSLEGGHEGVVSSTPAVSHQQLLQQELK
ncbi:hypothetical protein WJX74_003957 [Apatococcus lobatus]|uniref:Uncharacterized protein n=1 Tax=Apatococcus lobatus TaxID=904363 RepID=A0AAW1RYZ3_9CHLO